MYKVLVNGWNKQNMLYKYFISVYSFILTHTTTTTTTTTTKTVIVISSSS